LIAFRAGRLTPQLSSQVLFLLQLSPACAGRETLIAFFTSPQTRKDKMKNIYVGNVDLATTEDELRSAFASYGAVQRVSVVMDRETGRPRGFAFVEMESDKEAQEALLGLNGSTLGGTMLTVNEARPKTARVGS
jgi:cold-inducible RNA-binding protein